MPRPNLIIAALESSASALLQHASPYKLDRIRQRTRVTVPHRSKRTHLHSIIEALNGRTAHIGLWFYSGEDSRQMRRSCAVIPWQCGTDAAGGVMMVIGAGEASYASLEIADRTLGRSTRGLLQMLETIKAA